METGRRHTAQPISGAEERSIQAGQHRDLHAAPALRGLVLAACVVLLAACQRQEAASGETPQVAAAKAAVTRRLETPENAEFRDIVEYRDGVVCGEFNVKKMFSGTDIGFRKFIYNAPEPGQLAIGRSDLSPREIAFWCSDEPDKKVRMLAASVAELAQACEAARGNSSDMSCRLAATQKRALEELQGATAPAPGRAPPGQASPAAAAASAVVAQPAPAASASPPPVSGNADAAILAEVEAALRNWRERWEQGDVDGYLRMYEASFTGGAASHAQWEQQRRQKMKNARPSILVEGLQAVRITPQEVELRFVQVYSAKQHRDKGNKTMVFRRSPQGWRIADERWAAVS
jgi:hypothetical protein